jgi:transglutaminase-like putative cysteine protease
VRAPAGLVGATLLLWGASLGHVVTGIVLAIVVEGGRVAGIDRRLGTHPELAARVAAAAAFIFLAYAIVVESPPKSLYTWLEYLPLLLLPLALAALYRELDTTHAYAAIVMAAAGTGGGAGPYLYAAYALLVGWALIARAPRKRLAAASLMLVAAAAFGHAIHTGIWLLQGEVEELSTELFLQYFTGKADPFRERTRIGDLGRIKLSDRIAMRVEVQPPRPGSLLLRESSFEHYRNGEWRSARPAPRVVPRTGERWILSDEPATRRLTVRRSFPGGEGLLPLPPGTRTLEPLEAAEVEVFASGTARVRGGPRFAAFTASYDPEGERGPPNAVVDLDVPSNLSVVLEQVVAANGLRQPTPAATVEAVAAFFGRHFAYSLDLGDRRRTLADFLVRERKGHCEYFATATVLLLRALGVPARYAAGYSAQEWSPLERAFVVRNRHAHAWVSAFVDGRWIEVDTTPASWAQFEAEASRSFFGPVMDLFSWIAERTLRAWQELTEDGLGGIASWAVPGILVAGLGAVAWRLRGRWKATGRARTDAAGRAWKRVEAQLARTPQARNPTETVREWADRLVRERPDEAWRATLALLARAYHRVRFDPAAGEAQQREFIAAAASWSPRS